MKLSLDALQTLDAIDRRGSFAAAAEELHRVPSAITYQVRKLESDLDVALFDREGHRAVLTPAGRELLIAGRQLLVAAGDIEHRVRRIATGWEPELRVAIDSALPLELVWPIVAQFYDDCATLGAGRTRLRLVSEVFGGTWDALAEGRADIAVGAPGDPPSATGFRIRPLAEMNSVFAVAPTHPLATHPEPIPMAAIAAHRAVVAADSSRHLAPRTIGLLAGQDTLTVPDLATKIAAQAAGLGCGFVPLHLAQHVIAAGRLVVRQVEEARGPIRLSLAWREERPGRALQWWIDTLQRFGLGVAISAGAILPLPRTPSVKRRSTRTRR